MKKKLLIFAAICAMSFGAHELNAATPNPFIVHATEKTTDGKEIDLQGSCCSLVSATTAKKNGNTVCLTFTQSIGIVSVMLYDGSGCLIYSGTVDTSAQRVVVIPTGYGEGRCTLVVENASGYAEGDFERKK